MSKWPYDEDVTDEVEGAREAGLIVTITRDQACENPRLDPDRGPKLWFYKRAGGISDAHAGDEFTFGWDDFGSFEDLTRAMKKASRGIEILPVYRYEHSGVAYNTTGFHCPWDSGLAGLIYCTAADMRAMHGTQRLRNSMRTATREQMADEVKEYSAWASGDCWCVRIERGRIDEDGDLVIDEDAESLDDCCGYVGYDHAIASAAETVKYYAAQPKPAAA